MVSYMGYTPLLHLKVGQVSDEEIKEKLMTSIKNAIAKVQNAASQAGDGDTLTEECLEVCSLCQNLDLTLLHGLKEMQNGYWPCVQEFTHEQMTSEILSLSNVNTSLGHSRAWLLLSLNSTLLEGYVRSFMQNQALIKKYYTSPAFLKDLQRLELLATLVSGLEFIPFNLNYNNLYLDDVSTWSRLLLQNSHKRQDSLSSSSQELELSQGASLSPSSAKLSIPDEDSGVSSFEAFTAVEIHSPAVQNSCDCRDCLSSHGDERARISHLIDLEVPSEVNTEVEVISLTSIPKRKNSRARGIESSVFLQHPKPVHIMETTQIVNCTKHLARVKLSKTPPKNFFLPLNQTHSSNGAQNEQSQNSIETTPSLSNSRSDESLTSDDASALILREERGVPEGQEDPGAPGSCASSISSTKLTNTSQDSLKDTEFSIYDKRTLYLPICKKTSHSLDVSEKTQIPLSKEEVKNDFLVQETKLDISVGNNVLLYLMLEIFEQEEEQIYKMFLVWRTYAQGCLSPQFLLLTNKFLYILNPGNEERRFEKKAAISLKDISAVQVTLNYQGFTLLSSLKERVDISTGSSELTRNILSSLEVALRRFGYGTASLPSVVTNAHHQIESLKKYLSRELELNGQEFDLKDYRLVQWEKYVPTTQSTNPGGPFRTGFLMYRTMKKKSGRENKTSWQPGYFMLKACILYRFNNSEEKLPQESYKINATHCRACHRITSSSRPYTFEVQSSQKKGVLQLAASNEEEASEWLQDFLQALSSPVLVNPDEGLVACCLVLVGDFMITLYEGQKVLGKGHICDLTSVYTQNTFLVMEFEAGEADSCTYDWVFWFATEEEKLEFLDIVSSTWESLFKIPLSTVPIDDPVLLRKCLERSREIEETKKFFTSLCCDNVYVTFGLSS